MAVEVSPKCLSHLNRGKKRQLNIDLWKQTIRKKARDAGEAYVSARSVEVAAIRSPDEVSTSML